MSTQGNHNESTHRFELQIRMFGSLEVTLGEEPISDEFWGRRQLQDLLKILVIERGNPLSVDQLVEWLYPDLDPSKGTQNVRRRISELRRLLEPELQKGTDSLYIITSPHGGYSFSRDASCWIDYEDFFSNFAAAREMESSGEWSKAENKYQIALQLYLGEFLPEDIYEDWSQSLRNQLNETRLQTRSRLAECLARQGRFKRALDLCRAALEENPTYESLYRQKMLFHFLNGEVDQSNRTLESCRLMLTEHFDSEPSPETESLARQIKEASSDLVEGYINRPTEWIQNLPFPNTIRGFFNREVGLALSAALVLILSITVVILLANQNSTLEKSHIAVLPFETSGAPSEEFDRYVLGMRNELIATLSKIDGITVYGSKSLLKYKDDVHDIRELGRDLSAGSFLSITVNRDGDRLSVTSQLISAIDESVLWAENLSTRYRVYSSLQSQIAEAIAETLGVDLQPGEQETLAKAITESDEAYQHYLFALAFLNEPTEVALKNAIVHFQLAVDEDPNFAEAHAGLAVVYGLLGRSRIYLDQSAERALEIDSQIAEAHTALALSSWIFDRDFVIAEREFLIAIEINRSDALTHLLYSKMLTALGRHEEAIGVIAVVKKLEPLLPITYINAAEAHFYGRRYVEAIEAAKVALRIDKRYSEAHAILGLSHLFHGILSGRVKHLMRRLTKLNTWIPLLELMTHLSHQHAFLKSRAEKML